MKYGQVRKEVIEEERKEKKVKIILHNNLSTNANGVEVISKEK